MGRILLLLLLALMNWPFCATAQRQKTTKWESGMLEKGEKIGVWEYYSYAANGEQILAQKYDHTTGKMVYFRPDGKEYMAEVQPGVWEKTLLTQPPWCIGGYEALAAYMAKINYPAPAQNRNVQGKVVISFLVDTLGNISNQKLVQGIGSGCDEEALRVSRTVEAKWAPGRIGSRAVPVIYELPFTFRLK